MTWSDHLHIDASSGHGAIDVHPDRYHTADPHEVERDVAALCNAAARLGMKTCTIVFGRGLKNPSGETGRLRGHVERVLHRYQDRLVERARLTAEGGAAEVTFLWARRSKEQQEQANRVRNRVRDLWDAPSAAELPRARKFLLRIFNDWRMKSPTPALLACWIPQLERVTGAPPELLEEVKTLTVRWALCEVMVERTELADRVTAAKTLLQIAESEVPLDVFDLIQSEEDWVALEGDLCDALLGFV